MDLTDRKISQVTESEEARDDEKELRSLQAIVDNPATLYFLAIQQHADIKTVHNERDLLLEHLEVKGMCLCLFFADWLIHVYLDWLVGSRTQTAGVAERVPPN